MSLIKFTEFFKTQDHLQSYYLGKVVDNKDPLKMCRVKVTIPEFFTGADFTDQNVKKERSAADTKLVLPWCTPLLQYGVHGRMQIVPEINANVRVSFPYNDPHFPFYDFYFNDKNLALAKINDTIFDGDYIYKNGEQDSKGTYYIVNKKDGEEYEEFRHFTGYKTKVNKDGDFDVTIPGKYNIQITGVTDIHGDAVIKITSDVRIELNGNILMSAREADRTSHICPLLGVEVPGWIADGDERVKHAL